MRTGSGNYRRAYPNPRRPFRWTGEEHHFRSSFAMGDVVRTSLDHLGRIVAFDNTWSHVRGGRIVHLAAVGPGYTDAKGRFTAWEEDLCAACPYDRFGRHPHFPECGCGLELEIHGTWTAAPASWQVGATRCEQEEIPLTRRRLP